MNDKTKVSVKETTLDHLVPDDKNFNKGTEFGNAMLEKSLRKLGAGRSIVIDKNNRIIAGNKTIENAMNIGMEDVIVVETTGNQIVAVKRVDIDLDSAKGRELALADNATSKANLDWDENLISAEASKWDINTKDWGVDIVAPDDFGDKFVLKNGDKEPIEQMTFTLSSSQADNIRKCISLILASHSDGFMGGISGNTNKNGNALYMIVKQWEEHGK